MHSSCTWPSCFVSDWTYDWVSGVKLDRSPGTGEGVGGEGGGSGLGISKWQAQLMTKLILQLDRTLQSDRGKALSDMAEQYRESFRTLKQSCEFASVIPIAVCF